MPSSLRAVVGCFGLIASGALAVGLARDAVTAAGEVASPAEPVVAEANGPEPALSAPALVVKATRATPPAVQPAPAPRHDVTTTLHRTYRVTAYSDWGITASGKQVGVGQCAAPADIPFGSKVYIPALQREFVVTDRTHPRFRHNTVDLFMPGKENCRQFGRRYLECEVRLPEKSRPAARG